MARRWGAIVGLGLGGAIACSGSSVFECATDSECSEGLCQPVGFCSFPDSGCESGQRFGGLAGALSNTCVEPGSETDSLTTGDQSTSTTTTSATVSTTLEPTTVSSTNGATITADPTTSDSTTASTGTTGTTGTQPAAPFFQDDAFDDEFELGAFENTLWSGNAVEFGRGSTEGRFVSRVYDAGAPVVWQSLAWDVEAPYGKPLPPDGGAETDYQTGNLDLENNIVLLRFEGEGSLPPGSLVLDESGRDNHAEVAGATALPLTDGPFGSAADDNAETFLRIESTPDLDYGNGDFTWSLWFRTTSECTGNTSDRNQAYLGMESSQFDGPHLWMGCVRPTSPNCDGALGDGFAGGTFRATDNQPEEGGSLCGTTPIVDGNWHHMVVTKTGHDGGELRLYVDGVEEDTQEIRFTNPIVFDDSPDLAIGAFQDGTPQAAAALDEVAIWRRSLSAEQIRIMYLRGALRLGLQVRACDDATCDGVPWVGGDSSTELFSDSDPLAVPSDGVALPRGVAGRYAQYQVVFVRPAIPETPRLRSVTLQGQAPG